MFFAATLIDKPEGAALRVKTAQAHRAFVLENADRMLLGGPLTSADGGENIGSLIVIASASEADAKALLAQEPYTKAGLFERVIIHRFHPVIQNPDLNESEMT